MPKKPVPPPKPPGDPPPEPVDSLETSPNEQSDKKPHLFKPGNTFGTGRVTGSRNKTTEALQLLLDGEGDRLTRKAVEMALEGDTTAMRLCMDRLLPPQRERSVRFAAPALETASDVTKALGMILSTVASGDMTPGEGQTIASLLEVQRKAIETTQIEERIARLEERQAKPKHAQH